MNNPTYKEKLKDPRWESVRKRILSRDNNICQLCGSPNNLHVHHKYYVLDKEPWEYPDDVLITLCDLCHRVQHHKEPEDLLKQRLVNLVNEFVFMFTKSILEKDPLLITKYNALPEREKDYVIRQLNQLLDDLREPECRYHMDI